MQQTSSDEIDLAALVRALWQQKLLIVLVTTAVTIAAAAYAFLATAEYQVQSILRPAVIKDLDALNRSGVYELTPSQAMQRVGATFQHGDRLNVVRVKVVYTSHRKAIYYIEWGSTA